MASAAFVAVTEHVKALVTVRESVLVMLQPLVDVEYETAPVPVPPVVVSRSGVPYVPEAELRVRAACAVSAALVRDGPLELIVGVPCFVNV